MLHRHNFPMAHLHFFVKICQVLVTEGRESRSLQFREFHFTLVWIYDAWN